MLEVNVFINVRANETEGSLVSIAHSETVVVNHEDTVGMWLSVEQTVKRLVNEEVLPKALVQLELYKMRAETDLRDEP